MNWWHYLLLANLYLALFYGFYLLLLRKETYFMLNRIYLVSAAVLSFFIPLMQSEWVKDLFITKQVQQTIYYINPGFVYQVTPTTESSFTVAQFFTTVYWLVVMLLLARLIYRFSLLKKYMQSEETGSAFSFFKKIKVDENLPQKDVILQHEQVHATQYHSADVLLFEVLAILNWFNPVIYFYRKAIKHIHEFIADRNAISFGTNKSDYALLLLSQSIGVQPNTLVNSFFSQSLLKQRIMMLHKNPSRRSALLKYGLSAPLFALMLIFTSATVNEQKTILKISEKINSDATVTQVAQDVGNQLNTLSKPPVNLKTSIVTTTLNGKVVNTFGKPLANVKVSYKQNNFNTTTNEDGEFKISEYYKGAAVSFTNTDSIILVRAFENIAGKLQIVVIEDKKSAANKANSITITHSSDPAGVVSFAAVEKLPSFPGGEAGFSKFLASSIRYPKVAKDEKMQGRVIISFIVEKDGKLTDIKVLRDIGGGCGPEAIRVLSESPDWNPGMQKGEPVRVAYTMPINFTLAADNNNVTKIGIISTKKDSVTEVILTPPPPATSTDSSKRIRGIRINGTTSDVNKALIIVDGVELKAKDGLKSINPNDIESVTVLKDPLAIAKYGDKGKDGVILITTKKGKKATETTKP